MAQAADRRETGPLDVGDRLKRVLLRLRAADGFQGKPELDVEAVRDVDRALGWRLPADVLAVFAARISWLEDAREMGLAKVVGHTGRVRAAGAAGDLVGIGKDDARVWLCVQKGDQPTEGSVLVKFDADDRSTFRVPLCEYLENVLASVEEPGATAKGTAGRVDDVGAGFTPVLVRPLPEGSPGQSVRHKTFGDGKVLKEVGSGPNRKVQVDFPGRGLKLLQARFLEYLD